MNSKVQCINPVGYAQLEALNSWLSQEKSFEVMHPPELRLVHATLISSMIDWYAAVLSFHDVVVPPWCVMLFGSFVSLIIVFFRVSL